MHAPVAVIDIGSNTIKLLVATACGRAVETLLYAVEETRISRGIGGDRPALTEEAMDRGTAAVARLLGQAKSFTPNRNAIVATSAVRDATNRDAFLARIRSATGIDVRVLTGAEEAGYISRGLLADPAFAGVRDLRVFDLGGGSLECIAFEGGRVVQALSLPLGCVRLTERCVSDPSLPFSPGDRDRVTAAVRTAFDASGFGRIPASPGPAAATGGTVTTARAMLSARRNAPLETANPVITVEALGELLALTAPLPLAARREVPGLPAARADVFPTALATILEIARLTGVERFTHSLYNLRYGIAAELLGID